MRRRELLAVLGTASLAVFVSSGSRSSDTDSRDDESFQKDRIKNSDKLGPDYSPSPSSELNGSYWAAVDEGYPPSICGNEPIKHLIRAVEKPVFDSSWQGYDIPGEYSMTGELRDEVGIIGIEKEGVAKAYPLSVVSPHEIVNDRVAGLPVLISFCPLCNSAMTAVRELKGESTVFGVTGFLWKPPEIDFEEAKSQNRAFGANDDGRVDVDLEHNGNLVMYDELTRSFWSQIIASGICGTMKGEKLELVPSEYTTWGKWKTKYPETEVLLPPPHSELIEV